jgi:hypothetical protein
VRDRDREREREIGITCCVNDARHTRKMPWKLQIRNAVIVLSSCICWSTMALLTPAVANGSSSLPNSPKNDGPKMIARFSTFMRFASVLAMTSWKKPHRYCNNALCRGHQRQYYAWLASTRHGRGVPPLHDETYRFCVGTAAMIDANKLTFCG